MKNLVITASDSKYGNFLINHWLKSLQENVNLKNIDILILDYGLTNGQIKILKDKHILTKKCVRDGHPVILRLRDMSDFLSVNEYDQILSTDSGDIIFQDDINNLFENDKNILRASCENGSFISYNNALMNYSWLSKSDFFDKENSLKINNLLKDKTAINIGVFLGPSKEIQKIARDSYNIIKNKNVFGPDTPAINYFFYKSGFKILDEKYNYILITNTSGFYIKNGIFYLEDNTKIPIVHNAGGASFFRQVNNFGYGKDYNKLKKILYYLVKFARIIKTKLFNISRKKTN